MRKFRLNSFIAFVLILMLSAPLSFTSAGDEHHSEHDHKHAESSEKTDPGERGKSGHDNHDDHDEHGGHGEHAEKEEHGDHHGEHEDHEEEPSAGVGPGKAILAASKEQGIQLSEKALQALQIETASLEPGTEIQLPLSALVAYQAETGIYRLRDGWFKLIPVQVQAKRTEKVRVSASEVQVGDKVVVSGVPLLRVAELEAWGGSGDGHGH